MAQLISLPSEILRDICLHLLLVTASDTFSEYSIALADLTPPSQENWAFKAAYSNSKVLSSSFVANISALHNCTRSRVEDIYWNISENRCPLHFLLPLSLTCKRLHEIAEPLLWRLVQTDRGDDLIRIRNTVYMRPELGRQVKALEIRQFDAEYVEATQLPEAGEIWREKILRVDDTYQVDALLDLLPNLRSLKISLQWIPEHFSVFQPSALYDSGFPLGLQNLTEFSLHWEHPGCARVNAKILLPLFLLPGLKTLYLGHPVISTYKDEKDGEDGSFTDFTRYYGMSKITDLVIDFGYVKEGAFDELLKLPAALERLSDSYDHFSDRFDDPEIGIGQYFSALIPQKKSLRTLQIRECRYPWAEQYNSAPDPAILGSFTRLTEFTCPVRPLLFRDEHLGEENYQLGDVLPPNIQELTLNAWDGWTLDELTGGLKNFFSFGKKRYEDLKKMTVEYWIKERDFEFHGENGAVGEGMEEWEKEALGIIIVRMESLKAHGADKGVMLEVKLHTLG
jgi:hypothetical protein